MAASDRLSLLIETRTTGEAAVKLLEQSINRVMAAAEKSQQQPPAARAVSQSLEKVKKDAQVTGDTLQRVLSNPLGEVSGRFLGGASSAAKFGGAVVGITAGVVVAGAAMKGFIADVSQAGLEIRSLAQSTDLQIGQADRLRAAAGLAGFDVRNLKEASLDLAVALKDADGQGQDTRKMLRELGIETRTATGAARPLGAVLLETFDALSKIEDTTKRVNLSRVLGGEDAAKNVQPLLASYRELNKVAAELGFGTRDNLLKTLEDSNRELRKFDLQWEIIKGKLAEKIAPVVVPLILRFGKLAGGYLSALGGGAFSPEAQAANDEMLRNMFPSIDLGAALGRFRPGVPAGSIESSVNERRRAAEAFRAGRAGSESSMQSRLDAIKEERKKLDVSLSSDVLSLPARADLQRKLDELAREQFGIEEKLKFIAQAREGATLRIDSSTLTPSNIGSTIRTPGVPSLRRRGENALTFGTGASSIFVADQAAIAAANPDTGIAQARAAGQQEADARGRQLYLQTIRQELDFQAQKVQLLTGPGGELAAINQIAELKRAALDNELQAGAEIFDLNSRRLQIEEERTLRILELQRARREESRALASDLVGSIQDGNVGGFLRGEGRRLLNQVGTNAIAPAVQRGMQALGGVGAASGLGRLLQGTILDPGNATPIDQNTAATDRNTAAAERLTAVMVGGPVAAGGGGGIGGMLSKLGLPAGIFGGAGRNPMIFSANGGGPSPAYDVNDAGELVPITTNAAGVKMSGLSRGVGIAGALAGGAFGVVSGVRQGGVRGATTAVGSAAGSLAALLPLIGVAGPAAPIAAAVALGAMFVSSMLPDPKRQREGRIDRTLDNASYISPAAMNYAMTTSGEGFDYNRFGALRPIVVQQNISAMDAKGFIERRSDIAEATRLALQEAHGLNNEILGVVRAA